MKVCGTRRSGRNEALTAGRFLGRSLGHANVISATFATRV